MLFYGPFQVAFKARVASRELRRHGPGRWSRLCPPEIHDKRMAVASQKGRGPTARCRCAGTLGGLCTVGLLTGAVLIVYRYVWVDPAQLRWLGVLDALWEMGPWRFLMDYALHHGEVPLWNPLKLCGIPFAAHPGAIVFYPPNLLRGLLTFSPTPLRTHATMVFMTFLHIVAGAVGTYRLARAHGLSRTASYAAVFPYVFGANLVYRAIIGHWGFLFMAAWLPYFLLALRKALDAPTIRDRVYFSVAAGVVWGMVQLAGAPQMFVTFGCAWGAYYVVYRLLFEDNAFPTPARLKRLLPRDVFTLSLIILLGALVALVMLLPAQELAQYSAREKGDAAAGFVRDPENPPWNLLQLLVTYPGSRSFEGLKFAGAAALLVALASVAHPKRRAVLGCAVLFYIFLDCSLGPPFPFAKLLAALAPFDMAHPPRAAVYACLFLGLLAGYGVDALRRQGRSHAAKWGLTGVLLAGGAVVLPTLHACVTPYPHYAVSSAAFWLPAALLIVAFLTIWGTRKKWGGIALVGLVFADIACWNQHLVPFFYQLPACALRPGEWVFFARERDFWAGNRRGTSKHRNWNSYNLEPAINGYDPLFLRDVRDVICGRGQEHTYQRFVTSYHATADNERGLLFLKRSFWLARQYVRGRLPSKDQRFPAATTVFLPTPPEDLPVPGVSREELPSSAVSASVRETPLTIPEGWPVALYPRDDAFPVSMLHLPAVPCVPRYCVLRMAIELNGGPVTLDTRFVDSARPDRFEEGRTCLLKPDTEGPRELEILLPEYPEMDMYLRFDFAQASGNVRVLDAALVEDMADEDDRIAVVSRRFNSVEVEVSDLPAHRILTFVDADYPGWRAYIDSERVPILSANDVFKAVVVPPGTHEVRFEFRPWRVYAGAAVSGPVFVLALLYLVVEGWMRRRRLARREKERSS